MIDEICSKELYILYSTDRHLNFFFPKFMDQNTKMFFFWDIIEFEPMTCVLHDDCTLLLGQHINIIPFDIIYPIFD